MAGTVTTTEKITGSVKKITFDWTCDSAGDATATTTNVYDGKLQLVVTDPGATAPTDNYDITLSDDDSQDLLAGNGANRDTANTEYITQANCGAVAGSTLALAVSNAGDEKVGKVYVYIR